MPGNAPETFGIKLNQDWERKMTFSTRGQNKAMRDLRAILGAFGRPSRDLQPHPETFVFPGVTYLMPLPKAEAVIFQIVKMKSRQIGQYPTPCPGVPDGLAFRKYDIDGAADYHHLLIVIDRYEQVVAMNFNARSGLPYVPKPFPEFKPIAGAGFVNNFVDFNTSGGSQTSVADARALGGYIVIYTVAKGQTNTLYIPQPAINLVHRNQPNSCKMSVFVMASSSLLLE